MVRWINDFLDGIKMWYQYKLRKMGDNRHIVCKFRNVCWKNYNTNNVFWVSHKNIRIAVKTLKLRYVDGGCRLPLRLARRLPSKKKTFLLCNCKVQMYILWNICSSNLLIYNKGFWFLVILIMKIPLITFFYKMLLAEIWLCSLLW